MNGVTQYRHSCQTIIFAQRKVPRRKFSYHPYEPSEIAEKRLTSGHSVANRRSVISMAEILMENEFVPIATAMNNALFYCTEMIAKCPKVLLLDFYFPRKNSKHF